MEHVQHQEDLSLANTNPASCHLLWLACHIVPVALPCCKNIMAEKNAPWLDWPVNREVEAWHENILFSTVRERDIELLHTSLCLMAEHHESEGGS